MIDTKRTPGEWKAFRHMDVDEWSVASDKGMVAYCGLEGNDYSEDNAKLIAAAPDLHDALEEALSAITYIRQQHGDLYGVGWNRVESAAAFALGKARGGYGTE